MSREILFTKSYKKDIKKYKNKPEILKEINEVINKLARDEVLEPRFFDHQLKGNESEFRECYIKPDLLLKYKKNDVLFILIAVRLGSHSQIF
ncbi:MAG: type II toxin-antitoxin system YafQ family toxin [Campylobacter sp.]|nr:type II toxin-antitoxin system YafQ family toxin [Campylobacter sp.]